MKKVRLIKQLDVYAQMILIAVFSVICFINMRSGIAGYFIVGGWQVMSSLVHIGMNWFCNNRYRKYYYKLLVSVIVLFIVALIVRDAMMFFYLYFILFFSPCMALFYLFVCHYEAFVMMKRPMEQLK